METIMANVTYEIDEPTFNKYRTDIEDRLCKIDKRKTVDKAFACGSGFLGGFIAFFTKDIF
jgi:hypothetical protein